MAAQKGRLILIKRGDGAGTEVFTSVAGMRSKTITVNNETVDITTADDAPWRQLFENVGVRSVSVSGSGVFQDDSIGNLVEDDALAGAIGNYELLFENGDKLSGAFAITSFEYGGEHTAEQTFSMSLESSGTITMTRA